MSKVILKPNIIQPYKRLLDDWDSYYIAFLESGRGSGKSQGATKAGFTKLLEKDKFAIALIRSENTRLEQGIFKLFKMRANELNEKADNCFDEQFELLDTKIKNKSTGIDSVFNYGLKASSVDLESKKGKAKGLEQINLAIIEEAQDIKDFEVVKTLIDTCIRENDFKIWLLFNPPKDRTHWLYQHFYELAPSDIEGYDHLKPLDKEGVLYLHSDYTQNPHLNEATRKLYASYVNNQNKDDYYHDILGLVPKGNSDCAVIKDTYKESWRDSTDKPYYYEHHFIQQSLKEDGYYFLAFDGGAHGNRKTCVIGYHVERFNRDILLREFSNTLDNHDLRQVSLQAKQWMESKGIFDNFKLYGDPVIRFDGVEYLIEETFNKKLNTMYHFEKSENAMLRNTFQLRRKKRLGRLASDIYEMRADKKPAFIICKEECPKLYLGYFEGFYQYDKDSNGNILDKLKQYEDGQYKHLTDICDAYTYYVLAERPFTVKSQTEQKDKENRLLYINNSVGWTN